MQDHERRSIASLVAEVWRRRKWLGIVLFTMPAAGLLSLAVNLPNLYSSTATVLVEQQQVGLFEQQATKRDAALLAA